ncbi:MAG: single-stranded-DNA-specific exonuclease RecJ [Clostridiales bacterium]|nr:single-stranded-DNA-specific exonuclease RecJ [Clostridiales bacterium]
MTHTRFIPRCHEDAPSFNGMPAWFSSLLYARGIQSDEEAQCFLNPSLRDLHDPFLLPGMAETVALLRKAVAEEQTVLVYGDYDADGVCAASILLETLHEEGAKLAYRIPSRHTEGYGLNTDAVREIAQKAQVLITVDCGVSNAEEVALAKELGLTVIVTDHHQPPEVLPKADVVMDPLLGNYPFRGLCGAGVALKICQALQGMAGVEKRLDLAAIATVADVVPLQDENRVIVREGLRRIETTDRPGLKAMLDASETRPPLSADDLAFRLGPRLNAAGRLGDAKLGVHLLLTADEAKASNIAAMLEEANRTRQRFEREMTARAITQLDLPTLAASHVVLVSGEDWNPGLIGLTAGRLCERFHLPAIALSTHGDTAVGSCRSIPGVSIYKALQACEDLLERYGGHEQAAGLTVKTENIPLLRERLESVISSAAPEETFLPSMDYDLVVPFRTWNPDSMAWLSRLEPTGCGNPPPRFLLQDAEVQAIRRVGKDGNHLKLTVLDEDLSIVEAIAFGAGDAADESPRTLDLLYRPTLNSFRGRTAVEAQVEALNII